MLKTEQLTKILEQYQQLQIHRDDQLKQCTFEVFNWQHERMQHMHGNLFSHPPYHAIQSFFLSKIYNLEGLQCLADQLYLMIEQKIKLDRWLPDDILKALIQAAELAVLSVELEQQLALYFIKERIEISHETMQLALTHHDFNTRSQQLIKLKELGISYAKFAQSFVLRSALRFAKNKIQHRGFSDIYHYLDEGFKAIRSHKQSKQFLIQLCEQEQCFLDYLVNAKPSTLHVYYDPLARQMKNTVST